MQKKRGNRKQQSVVTHPNHKIMKICTEDYCRPEYLTIYESEVRIIAGISALWGEREIEAGGAMFGLWTHGARPVILLMTGPGRKAIHEPAYFEQDVEFVHRTNGIIAGKYGIQLLGFGHCHHFLGLLRPSTGDVSQVQNITSKNNFTRWCEIITTCERGDDISRWDTHDRPKVLNSIDSIRIRVNAYLYTDPQQGEKAEVPLRVISGISPFRLRILADGILDPDDIGEYASGFSKEQIIYDSFDFETGPSVETDKVLEALAAQCQELPMEAQDGIRFDIEDGFVTVTLPLPDNGDAHISFSDKPPFPIRKVCVRNESHKKIVDVTAAILIDRSDIKLHGVYEILTRKRRKKVCHCLSWSKTRACFDVLTGIHSDTAESLSKPTTKGGPKNVGPKTK